MIKEQQHSLNISNSNAQCQGSQTLSLSKEELSRYSFSCKHQGHGLSPPFLLIRGTPGWGLGGKPVPTNSGALCGLPASTLSIPSNPQSTI